jgi:signal transduction histidine kinase
MDSIFDVFYTTKKNGTGMGLSISRNIIEAHGGELAACNNEGTGATFVMKLPLQVLD